MSAIPLYSPFCAHRLMASLAGALIAAPVTNRIGRKYCLMANCTFFLLGAAVMTASPGNLGQCE